MRDHMTFSVSKMAAYVHNFSPGLRVFTLFVFSAFISSAISSSDVTQGEMDILQPYKYHHGPRHGNRYVRDCQPVHYGNVTHELYKANANKTLPTVNIKYFIHDVQENYWTKYPIFGHIAVINNPVDTISVIEPGGPGGCKKGAWVRETVQKTAEYKNCIAAVNAGFFNTTNGACYGDIVTDGIPIQNSGGIQNAHFGVKKDGNLFFGYLSEDDALHNDFLQLVGGVFWILRNGESYINASTYAECGDTEETGTLQRFADVKSARTAVGHDKEGRVVFVQVDGKTHQRGLNLNLFAKFLKEEVGLINAINLDGGGSGTMVVNGSTVSYPGDSCPDHKSVCARKVSTVVCAHAPECHPGNCSNHGDCINGDCHCHGNWHGAACDSLKCGSHNCSGHGVCTAAGCQCSPGWLGEKCNTTCPPNKYGLQCYHDCQCQNEADCDPVTGACICKPGYTGRLCDQECPYGFYGAGCHGVCFCDNTCGCDHVDGLCNQSALSLTYKSAGACLAGERIKNENLVPDQSDQYNKLLLSLLFLSIIAAVSVILNISLLCIYCSCTLRSQRKRYARIHRPGRDYVLESSDSMDEGDELEETELTNVKSTRT